MKELIKVQQDNDRLTVLARDLHKFLEVGTAFKDWFPRMCEYGFEEDKDYVILPAQKRATNNPKNPITNYIDYQLTMDMGKEISMIQRNEKGKQARQYFIEREKQSLQTFEGLSTEMQALIMHDKKLVEQDKRLSHLEDTSELSSVQRKKIKGYIHQAVIIACGGKKKRAYKELSKKVYSAIYRFLYDHYDVAEYSDIPRVSFDEARELIENWYPDFGLQQTIDEMNAAK